MAHEDEEEIVEGQHGGHSQADLIASYLAFGGRAIRQRPVLASLVFVGAAVLTVLLVSIWPRTYHCEMRLVTQHTEALNRNDRSEGFKGASEIIRRRENLETVVRQTELLKNWPLTRPPALKFKDRVMEALRGPPNDADMESMLVATLESKLTVATNENTMTIGVDWPDPQMAGKLVEATHQTFLQVRHSADVSTIAEYISILEGHAGELRQEIDTIAEQVQKLTGDRGKPTDRNPPPAASDAKAPPAPPRRVATRPRLMPDEDLPRLKTNLELKHNMLKTLQEDRKRRVIELQARLSEAKARYTPAHPAVVDLERQLTSMSEDTAEITALKGTVEALEAEIKERTANYEAGSRNQGTGGGGAPQPGPNPTPAEPPQAGPLPTDVMQLVQNSADSVDPAIAAQFRYVVSKYTTVRDQISTARIDLDTAQAAFRHRYKVLTPAEIPNRPIKPKIPVMVAGGLLGGLLLALLLPIGLELRRGKIVERWQVAQIHLPVLAELRFPPSSPD